MPSNWRIIRLDLSALAFIRVCLRSLPIAVKSNKEEEVEYGGK
jgi:hypothetical protein